VARALTPVWLGSMVLMLFGGGNARSDVRFFVYDLTTATRFTELYLAASGTGRWGANQVLSDKDRVLDPGERLALSDIAQGVYDVRFVDANRRACIKRGVDLTRDTTFDIRDADLAKCLGGPNVRRATNSGRFTDHDHHRALQARCRGQIRP